ncbi:TIR domain-containing protein [Parasphingopyxis sp. CP4]|uniref:TIR domain-containing protein n=1 Tax=Parasphingopyxis sp. CP4 TaxID=2724527 RepID=UPI0015A235CA|nr:TIR domain-containing protein [Parasphingopyxis sp. CP4]QLC22667.1 TIR domain-containing protein [Parasphingopyxis sp. CP4]
MADIFISYARADLPAATSIAALLEDSDHSFWWDQLIDGGERFSDDIETKLDAAKVVIVLWSEHSRKSRWVKDEAETAAQNEKMIPISLDGDPPPLGYRQFQSLDFSGWSGAVPSDHTDKLLDAIEQKIRGSVSEHLSRIPVGMSRRQLLKSPFAIPVAVGGVAALAGLFVMSRDGEGDAVTPASDGPSVAILPFSNLTESDDSAFFARGLHDELLAQMSRLSGLSIIARESVMAYEASDKPIAEIAAELGVSHVFKGSVQSAGDQARISVTLSIGDSGDDVWQDSIVTGIDAQNIFRTQQQITSGIVSELGTVLTDAEQQVIEETPTENAEAYRLYLEGRILGRYGDNTEEGFAEAVILFDRAIALDPAFANAYAEKAMSLLSLYWSGAERETNLALAVNALDQAVEMAPNSPLTLWAMGSYHYWVLGDLDAASDYLRRASEAGPSNSDIWSMAASVSRRQGTFDDSLSAFRRALSLNPLRINIFGDLSYTLGLVGRIEEARGLLDRGLTISPGAAYLLGASTTNHVLAGNLPAAWADCTAIDAFDSGSYDMFRTQMIFYAGSDEDIRGLVAKWPAPRNQPPFLNYFDLNHAFAFLRLGDSDAATNMVAALRPRIEQILAEDPDDVEARKILPVLFAIEGNPAEVERSTRGLLGNPPPDNQMLIEEGFVVVVANAISDNRDTVFELIEMMMLRTSPAQFIRIVQSPFFDDLRSDPRYDALNRRYRQWLAES